jgi:Mn-dependent DtxR family transcriptional regulator
LKKYLNGKDGSFGRLTQICQYLGIELAELFEIDGRWQSHEMTFSKRQGDYLLEDEEALSTFFMLLYDGLTIKEVQKKLKLSKPRMSNILKKLDSLELIKWLPSDEVPYHKEGIVLWKDEGEFVDYIRNHWSRKLLNDALALPAKDAENSFHLSYFKLTTSSRESLRRDLKDLIAEYQRRSRQEINYYGLRNLEGVRLLANVLKGSFVGVESKKKGQ